MGEDEWSIFKCNSRPFNFLRSMFSTRTEITKYANDQEADEQLVITGTSHTMSGSRVRKVFDDQSQCKAHANP